MIFIILILFVVLCLLIDSDFFWQEYCNHHWYQNSDFTAKCSHCGEIEDVWNVLEKYDQ